MMEAQTQTIHYLLILLFTLPLKFSMVHCHKPPQQILRVWFMPLCNRNKDRVHRYTHTHIVYTAITYKTRAPAVLQIHETLRITLLWFIWWSIYHTYTHRPLLTAAMICRCFVWTAERECYVAIVGRCL